ncbi:hypothetical protein GCM10027176_60250 [Actinoallomurus bryophytorum]|uniref:hypothetical protein n=1 Tax=Actinoallomurus bryophytorum TaxID=1490222 RepID=UPI00114EEE1F|nr:hypothetical protein [Actinoallomurus bryophytorum]
MRHPTPTGGWCLRFVEHQVATSAYPAPIRHVRRRTRDAGTGTGTETGLTTHREPVHGRWDALNTPGDPHGHAGRHDHEPNARTAIRKDAGTRPGRRQRADARKPPKRQK